MMTREEEKKIYYRVQAQAYAMPHGVTHELHFAPDEWSPWLTVMFREENYEVTERPDGGVTLSFRFCLPEEVERVPPGYFQERLKQLNAGAEGDDE